VQVCSARAERAQVELELRVLADLPLTRLDERALEIATINLIDNALKYASDGRWVGVEVRAGKSQLEVVVRDRGPGIPPEDRQNIFERFARRNEAKRVRGSGIGLALVKSVAKAHGGRVWVEDNVPSGSAFVLRIPVRR
jgi:two-component system phosphate regulon sensor histidine kinase PhoR